MTTKVAATWGTFDGDLHPGHLNFLKSCATYGKVTVFIANDRQIRENKYREPIYTQNIRKQNLLATGYVSEVIIGDLDQESNKHLTFDIKPDIYVFGEDQTSQWNKDLERLLRKSGVQVVRLSRHKPHLYSTSALYFGSKSATKKLQNL